MYSATGRTTMWLCLVSVFIAAAGLSEAAEFPVTRFGAVADDEAPDTAAIQAAIDACGQAGGGPEELMWINTCVNQNACNAS